MLNTVRGRTARGMAAPRLLFAALLAAAMLCIPAKALEDNANQIADDNRRLTLNYRRVPLERVLDFLARAAGKNIKLMMDDEDAQEEVLSQIVTIELEGVTWSTALNILSKKYDFVVNTELMRDGVIILERPARITMNVTNSDIGKVIKLIARQANVSIVIGPEVKGKTDFSISNVPWRDALESILKTHGFMKVEDPGNIIRITTPEKVKQQLESKVFALRYITPDGARFEPKVESDYVNRVGGGTGNDSKSFSLLAVLEQIKSPAGSVVFERRTNRLIVKDTPALLAEMERVINEIDIPPLQVMISTRILSVTTDDGSEIGVDWTNGFSAALESGPTWQTTFPFSTDNFGKLGGLGEATGLSAAAQGVDGPVPMWEAWKQHYTPPSDVGDVGDVDTTLIDYSSTYTMGTLSFASLQAVLQFVQTNNKISLMQAPQIVAMDNEEATIHVGEVIRYAEFYSETTDGGVVSGYRQADPLVAGVQLIVLPHVTADSQHVIMTVIPKTEDFNGFETFGSGTANEIRLPQTSAKVVMTKMMLADNETGVIAGLINENTIQGERKVPILGDIPIIGYAFKRASSSAKRQNIVVLITPQIIKPNSRKDFDQKMNSIRDEVSSLDVTELY